MANINAIKLPDGNMYNLVDETSGYITSSDLPTPLIGTTVNTTPTQVVTALAAGRNIEITHTDTTYGDVIAYSFNYAEDIGRISSNAAISVFGTLILTKLVGNTNDNTWNFEAHELAQSSDIPTATSDLTNDSGFVTTDKNVKQIPLNGTNEYKGLLFSYNNTETISSTYSSDKIQWNDYSQELTLYNNNKSKYGALAYDRLMLGNTSTSYFGTLQTTDLTNYRSYNLPDKAGTIALTSDIPSRGTATSGGTTLSLVNTGDMYIWNQKQDALVSGTNIKTINNQSLVGSGNISIQSEPEIFIAEYDTTTYAEVLAAYNANKTIICKINYGNYKDYFQLLQYLSRSGNFQFYNCNNNYINTLSLDSVNGWSDTNETLINDSQIFIAEYNVTTFNEIKTAYEANKQVLVKCPYTIGEETINILLNLIGIYDQLSSESPYASALFTCIMDNILEVCMCIVSPDPENPGEFMEVWFHEEQELQPQLISGTNIKTINNQSILTSGNIDTSTVSIVRW